MPDSRGRSTETEIQGAIKTYLMYKKWFVFKNHQSMGSYKGIADLFAIKAGVSIWLEVKKPTGKQNDDQIRFQGDIKEHGGNYFVVQSVDDIEFIVKMIEGRK